MSRLSLKTKISLTVSLLVICLMSAMAFFSLAYFEKQTKKTISEQQFSLISEIAGDFDEKIATAQDAVVKMAEDIPRRALTDPNLAQRFLDSRVNGYSCFDNVVGVISLDGRVVVETPFAPGRRGKDFSTKEFFRKTASTGKPQISPPFVSSQPHHHPVIVFTAPVLDAHGRMEAIVYGSLDLEKENFFGKLAGVRIGKTGYLTLLTASRILIAHPDRSRILTDIPVGRNKLVDRAIAGFEGTDEVVNSRGVRNLTSFKRLKHTDWILGASYPADEAYASIGEARRYFIIATGTGAFVSVLIVWMLMRFLTAPLLTFTEHVERISGEDGGENTIRIATGDEIEVLAVSVNRMVEKLETKRKGLLEQLHFLQVLLDAIPAPIFYKDVHGVFLGCNTAYLQMYGLEKGAVVGKTVFDFIPRELADAYTRSDARLFAEMAPVFTENAIACADGTKRDVIVCKAAFFNADQTVGGMVGTILDLTERRQAEEALRESEERFHQIFEQHEDAIILFKRETFEVIDANPAAEALYGYSRDNLQRLGPWSFIEPGDYQPFVQAVHRLEREGSFFIDRLTNIRKDGIRFTVAARGKLIRLQDVEVVYCSISDITEKIRLEEEVRTSQARLIHANKMTSLGMLVSGIAYEINNPNNFISFNSALLAEAWKDAAPILSEYHREHGEFSLGGLPFSEMSEAAPKLFLGLSEGSRRINAIVNNLKDFAREDAIGVHGRIDINRLIQDALSILSHHIHKFTDNFKLTLAENLPLAGGNAQQIEQVVINLIMNALQALPDKSSGVLVGTAFDSGSGCLVIKVWDEGNGMSKRVLERAIEPFFTTRLDRGGTGLGLSISASILKEHNGSLEFESAPGKGTTATVKLPQRTLT